MAGETRPPPPWPERRLPPPLLHGGPARRQTPPPPPPRQPPLNRHGALSGLPRLGCLSGIDSQVGRPVPGRYFWYPHTRYPQV